MNFTCSRKISKIAWKIIRSKKTPHWRNYILHILIFTRKLHDWNKEIRKLFHKKISTKESTFQNQYQNLSTVGSGQKNWETFDSFPHLLEVWKRSILKCNRILYNHICEITNFERKKPAMKNLEISVRLWFARTRSILSFDNLYRFRRH